MLDIMSRQSQVGLFEYQCRFEMILEFLRLCEICEISNVLMEVANKIFIVCSQIHASILCPTRLMSTRAVELNRYLSSYQGQKLMSRPPQWLHFHPRAIKSQNISFKSNTDKVAGSIGSTDYIG